MSRRIFRRLIPPEEAIARVLQYFQAKPLGTENLNLYEAHGRIVSKTLFSKVDVPGFSRSRMDGFALRSEDTIGADEENPVTLQVIGKIKTGHKPSALVTQKTAIEISTGAAMPKGADSVVMVEYTHRLPNDKVQIFQTASPGQHVIYAGTDIARGELLFPQGTELGPLELGVLAAAGYDQVPVYLKPKVAVLATGDEIIEIGAPLTDGKIYDINSYTISAGVKAVGCTPILMGIAKDDPGSMRNMLEQALSKADVVITSGSTSAGIDDMMFKIIDDLGPPGIVVHGVAVRPGKPTILGVAQDKLVIGLPGYPTSAMTIFQQLVVPLLYRLTGKISRSSDKTYPGVLMFDVHAQRGRRTYHAVSVAKRNGILQVVPSFSGSSAITTLALSDGYIMIPENINFVAKGSKVTVIPFSQAFQPADIMIMGSHSLALDVVTELMYKKGYPYIIKRLVLGSIGGLHAVADDAADIAGIHIYDEDTSVYNTPYIQQHGMDKKVILIRGIQRPQGLIVAKGNPKGIKNIRDLLREDVWFINRNPGSGTRIFLDHLLRENGINEAVARSSIKGYEVEVKTHSAVASAVLYGRADAGLGIQTVAEYNNLDFVKIGVEYYDFAINRSVYDSPGIKAWLETLRSKEYHETLRLRMPWIHIPEDIGKQVHGSDSD
ncbi:MAG: molybdopterin biosynthesis protein [Candidatus Ranarchaeia archaeon]